MMLKQYASLEPFHAIGLCAVACVAIITTGVTLTHIFEPPEPPRGAFDPVQECLAGNAGQAKCEAFFKSLRPSLLDDLLTED